MKKNPKLLLIAGVVVLAVGIALQFAGGTPSADPAARQQCEQKMTANGADPTMVARCSEATFAIATTATDANAAAEAISRSNSGEVGGNVLSMFLIGLGLALTIGGLVTGRKRAV